MRNASRGPRTTKGADPVGSGSAPFVDELVDNYLRSSVAATCTNMPVSSAINRPRPRGSGPPFILPRMKPSSGSASITSNGAFACASARSIGSLPADDQPPNVRVTSTCKPTSAALVTQGAALCSGESKPGGSCWTSSMIRKISGPLHQARDSSSSADRPGGGSRRGQPAPQPGQPPPRAGGVVAELLDVVGAQRGQQLTTRVAQPHLRRGTRCRL